MKRFFSTTTGRLLLGCLVVIIVVGISIAAVSLKKKKSGTNETTAGVLQENSEVSVLGSDLTKEETTEAVSEPEKSETEETAISQEENNTSNIPGTSETSVESAKLSEPIITPTETVKPSEPIITPTETAKPSKPVITPTETAKSSEPTTTTTIPENLSEDDLYFQSISTVISVIKADESPDVQTEEEASEVLKQLGFDQYPITYDYSMGGKYSGDKEITNDPKTKRPMYSTYFKSDSGNLYNIYLMNGVVLAFPVSFNMESDLEAELLISESNELTIYSSNTDKYYVIIPYKTNIIVKVIDKINAETLNKLTNEEIKDYES